MSPARFNSRRATRQTALQAQPTTTNDPPVANAHTPGYFALVDQLLTNPKRPGACQSTVLVRNIQAATAAPLGRFAQAMRNRRKPPSSLSNGTTAVAITSRAACAAHGFRSVSGICRLPAGSHRWYPTDAPGGTAVRTSA